MPTHCTRARALWPKQNQNDWVVRPLTGSFSNVITGSDVKAMEKFLEYGAQILRDQTYFEKNNNKMMPLINQLNEEISEFEEIYELIK